MRDCCSYKATARANGYFEGPGGRNWFTHNCQGWPKASLWSKIKEFFR